ncbi:MAG: DUF2849 domain-containing protein [Pikeienuella sp.]
MAKKFISSVLTANHLIEGDAVWWTGTSWSRDIADATIANSPDAATQLEALGSSAGFESEVVGPYLVEVSATDTAPQPIVRREAIRADRNPTFAYGYDATPRAKAA